MISSIYFAGGTCDIVAHEIVCENEIKELLCVNGGPFGGNAVNNRFTKFMGDILGHAFIEQFQRECPEHWFVFINRFERAKKMAEDDGNSRIKLEIPWEMKSKFEEFQKGSDGPKNIEKVLNQKEKGIRFSSGSIVLSNNVVKALFQDTVQAIVTKVREVLDTNPDLVFDYIFMVGGFSESSFLQRAIKQEFEKQNGGCKVIIPDEAQMAIIRGAVLNGHYQDQITSRIAKKTYGTDICVKYDALKHDVSKTFTDTDGSLRCEVFHPLVEIGESIPIGLVKEEEFSLAIGQSAVEFDLYSVERTPILPVEYLDNQDDQTLMGTIRLETPCSQENKTDRKVVLRIAFGSTELHVEAIDKTGGAVISTKIDLLSCDDA